MSGAVAREGRTFRAMGTQITVRVDHPDADALTDRVRALFEEREATLSRFRPESELSRLNQRTGRPVAVGPLLLRTLTAAVAAARATGGAFDPTLGRQLVAAGYAQSFDLPTTSRVRIARGRPGGGWRDLTIDEASSRVTVPDHVRVDLGGIAKGMAVDAAIAELGAAGVRRALVNAGGDLRVLNAGGAPWPVGLSDVRGEFLRLTDGALATSSTMRRRWRLGHEDQHHLIDPRTGAPSRSGVWSVSVAAPTCEHAEVAAKAALVLGPVAGAAFLDRLGYGAVLSVTDGEPVRVGDWPRPETAA